MHQPDQLERSADDDDSLHVVTQNGDQCFRWRARQLTYIALGRPELPLVLATKFGPLATKLDLSYNRFSSFKHINLFSSLSELVLDNNGFQDEQLDFRQNLRLKTLSLNKNQLADLAGLVARIKSCFPNLEFLSLIGNPLWPGQLQVGAQPESPSGGGHQAAAPSHRRVLEALDELDGSGEQAYQKYRHYIIYHLPNLRFLDSAPIGGRERNEALRRRYWLAGELAKPAAASCAELAIMSDHDTDRDQHQHHDQALLMHPMGVRRSELAEPGRRQQQQQQQPKAAFMRLSYSYTGKNSEGNRFIRNQDL